MQLIIIEKAGNARPTVLLALKVQTLNLQLDITEKNIDGDEVESYEELDEYIDDIERYFVITVSGWLPEVQ